jgi:hypothetical protein
MKRDENFFQIDQIEQERARSGKSYLEFLARAGLSAGVYTLPAAALTCRKPHQEDESVLRSKGAGAHEGGNGRPRR